MKLYAPKYYKDFKCTAQRCRHSCCVGWEIGVDEVTLCKYGSLPKEDREEILSHITDGVIALSAGKRCPFLDCSGLCKIISRYGEEYTSEICREHPRFYNVFTDRAEVGIGASCEEAARIILSSDSYDSIELVGNYDGLHEFENSFISEREYIYSVLKNPSYTYNEKFSKIKEHYGISKELLSSERLEELFSQLEYLKEEDRELFSRIESAAGEENAECSERFFAYLVYRHMSFADSYENFRARLCMCLALLGLFESLCRKGEEPAEAARLVSEEIEYSEDNTDSLIFTFECEM